MYVHIGGDVSISDRFIVAILNLDDLEHSQTQDLAFLEQEEQLGRLEILTESIPESVVIALDRSYLSPLPVAILRQRLHRASATLRRHQGSQK